MLGKNIPLDKELSIVFGIIYAFKDIMKFYLIANFPHLNKIDQFKLDSMRKYNILIT